MAGRQAGRHQAAERVPDRGDGHRQRTVQVALALRRGTVEIHRDPILPDRDGHGDRQVGGAETIVVEPVGELETAMWQIGECDPRGARTVIIEGVQRGRQPLGTHPPDQRTDPPCPGEQRAVLRGEVAARAGRVGEPPEHLTQGRIRV